MIKRFLPLLLLLAACVRQPAIPVWNIADFGATPGEDCTMALQTALDQASAQGGGRVVVPTGTYLCSTFYLRDSVDLHLEAGSVLLGVDDPEAYFPYIPEHDLSRFDSGGGTANANCVNDRQWMKALVIGAGVKNASISGEGTLDGAHVFDPLGEEGMRGPHTIIVAEADNFRMEGIHVTCAANYAFLGYALNNAVFEGLSITEGWDGIHIRGGKDVVIRRCNFQTGDDSIAGGYWDNLLVEDCEINSSCNGIRMIMPSEHVVIRNSHFYGPGVYPHRTSGEAHRTNMLFGVVLEPGAWGAAPGESRDIVLSNLQMENLAAAVSTSVREDSTAYDLVLEDIHATKLQGNPVPIASWNDQGFRSVTVRNCSFSRD